MLTITIKIYFSKANRDLMSIIYFQENLIVSISSDCTLVFCDTKRIIHSLVLRVGSLLSVQFSILIRKIIFYSIITFFEKTLEKLEYRHFRPIENTSLFKS